MRGSVAKELRGKARSKTMGLPEVNYATGFKLGRLTGAMIGTGAQVRLGECTRRTYKQLKRAHKAK